MKELGAGGMGTVYLARDRKHDRRVAIKAIRPDLTNEGMRRRFQREIKITARLQHPHILPLLDSGLAEDILYYIMPYVEGESLERRLERDRTISPEQIVWIARDVCRGLDAAHQKHVVHRDIKPGNIMLLRDQALILDFGIAKALATGGDGLVTAGGWLGTPAYMAPEQFHGHATPRSDLYSLAAVLFEALTGRSWPIATKRKEPDWSGVSPGLQRILSRALREQPGDRWPTAGAFAEALEQWDRRGSGGRRDESSGLMPFFRRMGAKMGRRQAEVSAEKSIAVLPLRNVSRDEETEYFSDGITEDIIAQLSKVHDLRVISMTSVLRYKNRETSAREIGRALNVSSILEGSVRRAGNRVRIVSQLIDAETEEQQWAETYDRELTDIFGIQSEVARRIADSLDARLSTGERKRLEAGLTENLAAYDLYLRSRVEWNRRTQDSLEKSVEYLEDAVRADPTFGLAYAALASSNVTLGIYGVVDPHTVMDRARQAAEESLRIDPDQVEAMAALASVESLYDWDWAKAETSYRRALELGPNFAVSHQWYATHVLMPLGRFDSARYELDKAHELDPLAPSIATSVALLDYYQLQFDRAEKAFRNVLEANPDFWLAHYFLGWSLRELDRNDEAIAALQTACRLASDSVAAISGLAFAYASADREDEARAILKELLDRRDEEYVSPLRIAQVYAGLKETDEALAWLGQAYEGRDVGLAMLNVQRGFEGLQEEPRFQEIRGEVFGTS